MLLFTHEQPAGLTMLPSIHHPSPFQPVSPRHHRRRASPDEELAEDDKQRRREAEDAALKDQKLSHINRFIMGMNMLKPQWADKDPQLAKRVEDQLVGLMFNSNAPLPISSVARDMGITLQHDQLIKVGATVARLYRDKHRAEPPKKHSQWGEERRINAYTEADRDLIVAALDQIMSEWTSNSA
jgi:hypothetical protein